VCNKFIRVCEACVLFPIFIEFWLAVGRFAVGCVGSNEAANRKPLTRQPNFDENGVGNYKVAFSCKISLLLLLPLFAFAQSPPSFKQAEKALETENYKEAIALFEQIINTSSSTSAHYAMSNLRLGRCHIDLGDYQKALNYYQKANETSSNSNLKGEVLTEFAFALQLSGRQDTVLLVLQEARKIWNNAFPSNELEIRWRNAYGRSLVALGKPKEALDNFLQGEKLIKNNPKSISSYEKARLFTWLAGRYTYLGWEGSKKTTLDLLRKALVAIPKQEIRWGHIALEAHELFDYREGNILTLRLDSIYSLRLGDESIGKAFALQARVPYLNDMAQRKKYIEQAGAIIATKLGKKSISYYENQDFYIDKYLIPENKFDLTQQLATDLQQHFEQQSYYKGTIYENLLFYNAYVFEIKKDTSQRFEVNFEKYVQQIAQRTGAQSLDYAVGLGWKTNRAIFRGDTARATKNLAQIKEILTIQVGDSSSLWLNGFISYYSQLAKLYEFQTKETEATKMYQEADRLAVQIYGKQSCQRAKWLLENKVSSVQKMQTYLQLQTIWENTSEVNPVIRQRAMIDLKKTLFLVAKNTQDNVKAKQYLDETLQYVDPNRFNQLFDLQYLATSYYLINDFDNFKKMIFKAKERIETEETQGIEVMQNKIYIYQKLNTYYQSLGKCDSAAYYLEKVHVWRNQFEPYDKTKELDYLNERHFILRCQGVDYAVLLEDYKKMLEQKTELSARDYTVLSQYYDELGQFALKKYVVRKLLERYKKEADDNPQEAGYSVQYWTTMAEEYSLLHGKDTLAQNNLYRKALAAAGDNPDLQAYVYEVFAGSESINNQYPEALYHYLKVKSINIPRTRTEKIYLQENIAMSYLMLNRVSEVNNFYETFLSGEDSVQLKSGLLYEKALQYTLPIIWLKRTQQFDRALKTTRKVLTMMDIEQHGAFNSKKTIGKSEIAPLLYIYMAWIYSDKYDKTKNKMDLDSSLLYGTYCIQAIDELIKAAITDKDALVTIRESYMKTKYSRVAQTQFRYIEVEKNKVEYWKSAAFSTADAAKSAGLVQAIRAQNTPIPSNIANEVQQERKLYKQILIFEKNIFKATGVQKDLNDTLNSYYTRRTRLLKQMEQKNKAFYNNLYQPSAVTIADVQQKLTSNQSLIEYIITDSCLMTFVINKDSSWVLATKTNLHFRKWIKEFNTEIVHETPNLDALLSNSDSLYLMLLQPVAHHLKEELIIVPDDELALISFDALWIDDKKAYLGEKYILSNANSATAWKEMIDRPLPKKYSQDVAIFTPSYTGLAQDKVATAFVEGHTGNRDSFDELEHTNEECQKIKDLAQQKKRITSIYDHEKASISAFKDTIQHVRILHFAGHAKAFSKMGDYSYLVFSYPADSFPNNLLYAKDIYALNLPCELVTLSACETGVGSVSSSEGVIGLGSAFASAGAKSIVLSLWSVNDASTKDLMIAFYKNIFDGIPKNQALQRAKRALIQKGKSPFYWAAFNLYGDVGRLTEEESLPTPLRCR
jgi:CHAT domain-containing protein